MGNQTTTLTKEQRALQILEMLVEPQQACMEFYHLMEGVILENLLANDVKESKKIKIKVLLDKFKYVCKQTDELGLA